MMTALVLYCYCKGIRSSRAVQMACFDDVGCRVITGNQAIDHATVARFVRRHKDALTGLFVQVLAICAGEGLVTVDLVAGDGTKVKASASKAASRTLEELSVYEFMCRARYAWTCRDRGVAAGDAVCSMRGSPVFR